MAPGKVYLVLSTLAAEKYTDMVYRIVSVEPIMIEVITPSRESGPKFLNSCKTNPVDADEEINLVKAMGMSGDGTYRRFPTGSNSWVRIVSAPEDWKIPTATPDSEKSERSSIRHEFL